MNNANEDAAGSAAELDSSAAELKSTAGVARIFRAAGYTLDGLGAAWRHEHAFRQELFLVIPLLAGAGTLPLVTENISWRDAALLAAGALAILVVELLNSAIEAVVDDVSLARRPLAKRAKDMGSAAVALTIFATALLWLATLLEARFC